MKTYIIKNKINGLFKIGKSKNPVKRLSQIEQIKGDCELLLVINSECETLLHNHFYKSHIGNEWFLLTDSDIHTIWMFKNGDIDLTFKFGLMGFSFDVLKSNFFISINNINKLLSCVDRSRKTAFHDFFKSQENIEFIESLNKKFGTSILHGIGQKQTWVHLILFLEIAKTIHPSIKISIYEILVGIDKSESHQIVRLALNEGKKY